MVPPFGGQGGFLFSTAYLPPISYVSKLLKAEEVVIEQHEHYIKQTYRNRTEIYGANGKLSLTIPVDHHDLFTLPIKEVKISRDQPWQKIHWRSIESAYRNSPYFEYYEDDLKVFYGKEYTYLLEWNNELLKSVLHIAGIKKEISFTASYEKEHENILDLRGAFTPEKRSMNELQYRQVFSDKHGFIADLSIIDLLFNEGPKAIGHLQSIS